MRATEKNLYKYYNDMGKDRGHCTWGAGILAHRGVCTAEELGRKVSVKSVDQEFESQAQFDALCSLTYNTGPTGASGTYGYVNENDFEGAATNIARMIKVEVKERAKRRWSLLLD